MRLFTSKYSKEERNAFVEKWKASGQNKFVFAREHGIQETTFRHWIFKSMEEELKNKAGDSVAVPVTASLPGEEISAPKPSFVAIQIDTGLQEKEKPISETPLMEITLANGSRIIFYETVSPEYLQSLLK